jgi:hypothetical protein
MHECTIKSKPENIPANGNVPYSFAFTSSVIVAIGLSVTIFLGVTILGLMDMEFL